MKKYPGTPQAIHTATWFTPLPKGFSRINICYSTPRGFKGEYWTIKELAPGAWHNAVPPETYLRIYSNTLRNLDPQAIVDALFATGPNPVMVCYEKPVDIAAGTKFCHRHLAAKWLSDTLGLAVNELDYPWFNAFKAFDRLGIKIPTFTKEQSNILAGG